MTDEAKPTGHGKAGGEAFRTGRELFLLLVIICGGEALSAAEGEALSAAEGEALSAAEGEALSAAEGEALSVLEPIFPNPERSSGLTWAAALFSRRMAS